MDADELYRQLLDEIRRDEAALQKKRDVAEFIRHRLGNATVQRSSDASTPTSTRKTLTQHVAEAIAELGGTEFAVGDVYARMAARDLELPEQPKSKITTVLARMTERGELIQTFKGGGNVPNRYQDAAAYRARLGDATASPAGASTLTSGKEGPA